MKTKITNWLNNPLIIEHEDLKPCPFCGSSAQVRESGDGSFCVCCDKCFAKSGYQHLPGRWNSKKCLFVHLITKAVKAWNKRKTNED